MDTGEQELGRIAAKRSHLRRALHTARSLRLFRGQLVSLTLAANELLLDFGGASFLVEASGRWRGQVLVSARSLNLLADKLNLLARPASIVTNGHQLYVDFMTFPCRWSAFTHPRAGIPLDFHWLDVLSTQHLLSADDIDLTGLSDWLSKLDRKASRIIKRALREFAKARKAYEAGAATLEPLGVTPPPCDLPSKLALQELLTIALQRRASQLNWLDQRKPPADAPLAEARGSRPFNYKRQQLAARIDAWLERLQDDPVLRQHAWRTWAKDNWRIDYGAELSDEELARWLARRHPRPLQTPHRRGYLPDFDLISKTRQRRAPPRRWRK